MYRLFVSILLASLYTIGFAQKPTHQDCLNAIPICKNIYHEPSPYKYTGNGNYLDEISKVKSCYTEENNGVWYTFTALSDGYFKFTLEAFSPNDEDYDWIIFDLTDADCSVLKYNPEPYMVSSNNYGAYVNNQFTGANSDSVASPPSGNCNGPNTVNGPHFNDDILVKKGRTYVLYISNWMKSKNGYTINFSSSMAKIFDDEPPSLKHIKPIKSCRRQNKINFEFTENVLCSSVNKAKIRLTNSKGNIDIVSLTSDACKVGAEYSKSFTITTASPLDNDTYILNVDKDVKDLCGNASLKSSIDFDINFMPLKIKSIDTQDASCSTNDGSLSVNAEGGNSPYYYSINKGLNNFTKKTFSNLRSQTYTVTVTDAIGCSASMQTEIKQLPNILTTTPKVTAPLCNGKKTGEIQVNATSGTGQLFFSIDGGTTLQTENTFKNLLAKTYQLTIKDQGNCTKIQNITIPQPDRISIVSKIETPKCYGDNSGKITISSTGGTGVHSATWTTKDNKPLAKPENLVAGIYNVFVTDANNCVAKQSVTVNQPTPVKLSPIAHDILCFGEVNGTVFPNPTGGTPVYSVSVENEKNVVQSDLKKLAKGQYTIKLTDANSCKTSSKIEIREPELVEIQIKEKDSECFGENLGHIIITSKGGVMPFRYSIDGAANFQSSGSFLSLPASTYHVFVEDANKCATKSTISLTQPPKISIDIQTQHLKCFQDNTGKLTTSVNGGTGVLSLNWTDINNTTLASTEKLTAGSYTLKIVDENLCKKQKTIKINQPPPLALALKKEDVVCFGNNDGKIEIEVTGGTLSYTQIITNIIKKELANPEQVNAGKYHVKVIDANNCIIEQTIVIHQPQILDVQANTIDVTCNGGNDGYIDLKITGGVVPYNSEWRDTSLLSRVRANLTAGSYSTIVKDANNCEVPVNNTISQPEGIKLKLLPSHISCYGANDGKLDVQIEGNTSQLKYTWSTSYGSSTDNLNALKPDLYKLKIYQKDIDECAVDSVAIKQPEPLILNLELISAKTCNANPEGQILLKVIGGTPNYEEVWTEPTHSGLVDTEKLFAGNYRVTITDQHSCTVSESFEIKDEICPPEIDIPNVFTPNEDGRNDIFRFKATYIKQHSSQIINRWGNEVYRWTEAQNGWDGMLKTGAQASSGTFFYIINIVGQDGKSYHYKGKLALIR